MQIFLRESKKRSTFATDLNSSTTFRGCHEDDMCYRHPEDYID